MSKNKFYKLFHHKKQNSWPKIIALVIFYFQFIVSVYFLIHALQESCLALSQSMCTTDLDAISIGYFKIVFFFPIVILSVALTAIEIFSGWKYDIEQEIISVFIFLLWLIFALFQLF